MIAKRNKHYVHFLHLPPMLNWIYLKINFLSSIGQLLIGNTLHMKSLLAVFKQLKKLQKEHQQMQKEVLKSMQL